ncbi:MAG: hypothetical protein U0P30_00125 [Vicinamibacterales bacterium]
MRAHVRHLRMRLGRAIELDAINDRARLGGVRDAVSRGRHLPARTLMQHLLHSCRSQVTSAERARERESRGAGAVVVTGHAVLDRRARGGIGGGG